MRRSRLPLSILSDEGVGRSYRGRKRLPFEVPGLRGVQAHDILYKDVLGLDKRMA